MSMAKSPTTFIERMVNMIFLWISIWFSLMVISLKGAEFLLKKSDEF